MARRRPRLPVRAIAAVATVTVALAGGCYKLMHARTVQAFGQLTARVETTSKVVALTFDDGPTCADLAAVLSVTGGITGTFFVNGDPLRQCPQAGRALVAAGHELGNHTRTHRPMVFLTPAEVAGQILPTDEAIREAGHRGEILVRAPYGKKLFVFPWWLARHDRHSVMWDVAVETFGAREQTAAEIARLTLEQVRPGSIVLLHPWNGRGASQQAIPLIIAGLRARGYRFVTVSELLGR